MVVLPRHARRRFGNPYGNSNAPYSPAANHGNHGGYHGGPSSRIFSQQSILLLLAGMGLGYMVTVNIGNSAHNNIGLDTIVKNLEQQRAAAANPTGLSSPSNMMHNQHREAAALLRGEAGSNHAYYNHRRASSDAHVSEGEDAPRSEPDEDVSSEEAEDASHSEPDEDEPDEKPLKVKSVGVKKKKHTFEEQAEAEEDLSGAQQRFIETQKLIASQSIPTPTNPIVMKTPTLADSKRKKILITGGAGFVGSHLTDKLMMEGHEVIVLDNFFTGQRKNVEHWMHHPRFSLIVHDVTEPIMLEVDEIYHLACPASPPHYQYNPVKTIKTSTMGTINMLGLAKRVGAKMLLTSTSEIYGDPQVHPQPESYWGNVNTIGPRACYDEGKRVAETMMYSYKNQNNVDVRVARIFNTFGPRMHPNDGRVVSNFIIQTLQDKPLTIYGDGSQTRSFQYVSDLVDGLHALMNGGYDMPVNLGNPEEYTVKHFAEYIKEITGSGSEISFLPATKDDPTQRKPDISTAKRELNWQPRITVKEGLQKTIAYFGRVLEESGEIIPTGQEASRPKPKVVDEV
eukprot:CAMPEP_0172298568 /NCGR_PEP_ID=MMETSP1058-20130122/1164_1 /TAXON_ID=83371 /ORGANISM="Detonula confervacea, Strain CCMP 353" /LENGTH=567 /DNA_ID=CAMNT_0013007847 /DNA_START=37 /DNA_END=1740 /DNA_ORIENTATION=-